MINRLVKTIKTLYFTRLTSIHRKKHIILKALQAKKRQDGSTGNFIFPYNGTLTGDEIIEITLLSEPILYEICETLIVEELIVDVDDKWSHYLITSKGTAVLTNKKLLNQIWWRNRTVVQWAIGIIVGLIIAFFASQ